MTDEWGDRPTEHLRVLLVRRTSLLSRIATDGRINIDTLDTLNEFTHDISNELDRIDVMLMGGA